MLGRLILAYGILAGFAAFLIGNWRDQIISLVALSLFFILVVIMDRQRNRWLKRIRTLADRWSERGVISDSDSIDFTVAPTVIRRLGSALYRWADATQVRSDDLGLLLEARQSLIDSIDDAVLTINDQLRIVMANAAAKRLFGPNIVDRPFIHALRHPQVNDAVRKVLGGAPGETVELSMSLPVETDFFVSVQPAAKRNPAGLLAIASFHNVTELRRAERMRGDFIANASHELKTPLSTLLGFIETLRGPAHDDAEARDRFLAIMHDQALRMSRLVNDLLSLSRIELNEHVPPTEMIDLQEVLEILIHTLELQAARRGIRIVLEAAEVPAVIGDDDELTQLFQNLIENAIKYAREKTLVRVRLFRPTMTPDSLPPSSTGAVAVEIIDQSEGIAREHLPRLTERFYRVNPTQSRAIGGVGLGLAIVKHIVSRHRGTLIIESEPNVGSNFTVYLPAAAASKQRVAGRQQKVGKTAG